MGVWVHTLSLAYGAEPERLGLAAATGVGNQEPMEWPLKGIGFAKCQMRFPGHFFPLSLLISHQQLIICERSNVCLGYLEYVAVPEAGPCFSSKINRR